VISVFLFAFAESRLSANSSACPFPVAQRGHNLLCVSSESYVLPEPIPVVRLGVPVEPEQTYEAPRERGANGVSSFFRFVHLLESLGGIVLGQEK
jgi:hypothetical protein